MNTPHSTLKALAEPNRARIVELLRHGPRTVGDIADTLELRQPQTSKHLKILSESGLLETEVDANRRIYSLRSEPFDELAAWLQTLRATMEQRFDNLDAYLRDLQSMAEPQDDSEKGTS